MLNLLGCEGKLTVWMSKLFDYLLVSLLWILCCIPILTIGASTGALMYTVYYCIQNDRGKVCHVFFRKFREQWKYATVIFLMFCLGILGIYAYIKLLKNPWGLVVPGVLLVIWFFIALGYSSLLDSGFKAVLKTSILLLFRRPLYTLFIGITLLAFILGTYVAPYIIVFSPAVAMRIVMIYLELILQGKTE